MSGRLRSTIALCLLASWTLVPRATQAAPWRPAPGLVPESTLERLGERYPSITRADELENLLRDLGRRHPYLTLEARFLDGVWLIEGQKAELIGEIEVELVTRFLRSPVSALVQNYIGQVDSPEIRKKIEAVIRHYLAGRGYPQSRVEAGREEADDGATLIFSVNEGDPCLIDRVELGFALPEGAKLRLGPGDICDREDVEAAITE